jgi:protein required for attachment to host cells
MLQEHWILVANAGHARLWERRSMTEPLVELANWANPAVRMKASATERAPLGHSEYGRTGLAPHTELQQRHRNDFAQTLARHLRQAALGERMKALALVVSNPFLGELSRHLDASVQKTVCATHALDWTALKPQELAQRLRQDLLL